MGLEPWTARPSWGPSMSLPLSLLGTMKPTRAQATAVRQSSLESMYQKRQRSPVCRSTVRQCRSGWAAGVMDAIMKLAMRLSHLRRVCVIKNARGFAETGLREGEAQPVLAPHSAPHSARAVLLDYSKGRPSRMPCRCSIYMKQRGPWALEMTPTPLDPGVGFPAAISVTNKLRRGATFRLAVTEPSSRGGPPSIPKCVLYIIYPAIWTCVQTTKKFCTRLGSSRQILSVAGCDRQPNSEPNSVGIAPSKMDTEASWKSREASTVVI